MRACVRAFVRASDYEGGRELLRPVFRNPWSRLMKHMEAAAVGHGTADSGRGERGQGASRPEDRAWGGGRRGRRRRAGF